MSKTWNELRNEYLKVCEMSCELVTIVKVPLSSSVDFSFHVLYNKDS